MNQCAINQYIQREGDADRPIKVSVIVPIYNAGDRIYKCLDTLVNQTLREIEIICVLDCPTDGTDKVVEDYALKDDRIVIVRNERNLHVSESRNEGLKVARGEYIGFSDHDDYRELYMYEQLYRKAKEADADVVVSDVKVVNEDRSVEICCFKDTTKFGFANSVLLPMHHENNVNQLSKSVWHSIYRNDFLQKYNIRFESREEFFEEDTLFNLKSCLLANSIGYVSMVLYCWDKHIDSESNRIFPHHVLVRRQLNSLIYIADFLKDNVFFDGCKDSFFVLISDCINTFYPSYHSLAGEQRKRLAELLKKVHFPLLGRYNLKLLSKKRVKLFFFVLKLKLDGRKA